MTSVSKNVYTNKLDYILNKYNSTYYRTIKTKPVNVDWNDCNVDLIVIKNNNEEDLKFKVGDHVRISKYKKIFAKGYFPKWSEEDFVVTKVKNFVLWKYIFSDPNDKKIIGTFYEKELPKTNKKEFRIEKVIKKRW